MKFRALITGANSGIGSALARSLYQDNWLVDATYRQTNGFCETNEKIVQNYTKVDFSDSNDIEKWSKGVNFESYDCIIFVHGTMSPIGKLPDVDFDEWKDCHQINYFSIMQVLHKAIPSLKPNCVVVTLAGGGVNNAPTNYNAYVSSKMSLVKANELLAADHPELIFLNVGPGWVDTPIHDQTLAAAEVVPEHSLEVKRRRNSSEFVPMSLVTKTIKHLIYNSDKSYSGRNFSVASCEVFDDNLALTLSIKKDHFKLRRIAGDI